MSQERDVYTCEKILKKRVSKGVLLYLIKWKDYPLKASTWEPAENILDPALLTAFEDEQKRKKRSKKKFKRPSQTSATTPEPRTSPQENSSQSPLKTGKAQLIVFNPQGRRADRAVIEEIVYEPELTKDPILVTDVTSKDLTVTISECKGPEGFFRT